MNKKAQEIFSVVMLLVFIPLLFTAVTKISKIDARTEKIGETTLNLKSVYEKAENALFYLEQSGLYSVKSIKCNHSDIKNQLNKKLEEYLSKYPDKSIQFPKNNYEITIIYNENLLIANAKDDLIIQFSKGNYSINPSFSVPCS
tara:strand:+ start:227 stop:658 length:432 start_codon:yes stop_codon:yes gene_type:complete